METPTPETFLTVSNDELQRLFREAKSNDFTRAQFEAEKTKRIVALCQALAAVATIECSTNGYSSETPRQKIMSHLEQAVNWCYDGANPVY